MEGKPTACLCDAEAPWYESSCKNGATSSMKYLVRNGGSKSSSQDLDEEESRTSCQTAGTVVVGKHDERVTQLTAV